MYEFVIKEIDFHYSATHQINLTKKLRSTHVYIFTDRLLYVYIFIDSNKTIIGYFYTCRNVYRGKFIQFNTDNITQKIIVMKKKYMHISPS